MTIYNKMATGALWAVLEKGGQQIISFILFLMIARLVGPAEYGLAMLCFVYLALANLLLVGLADGIITLQIKARAQLSTLFWVIFALGSFLSVLCYLGSNLVSGFYEEPDLGTLLQWFAAVPILLALQTVPQLIIMKDMNFRIYAIRSLISTIGSGIVGIGMALYGYGALALVFQQIVLYILSNVILWLSIEWRPSVKFEKDALWEILTPGLKMFTSNILKFTEEQLPRLFLGYFLGLVSVGFYAFAFRMRFALQEMLITPLFLVAFPALSEIKNDRAQHDDILSQIFFLIGLVILPAVTIAIILAPTYVPLLFGEKWIDAIPILQIFLILGYLAPFLKLAEVLFRTHNKLGIYLRGQAVLTLFGAGLIYIASQYSLIMVGWVLMGLMFVGMILYFYLLDKQADIYVWHHFKRLAKSVLSCLIMVICVLCYMYYTPVENDLINFVSYVVLGGLAYLVTTIVCQKQDIIMTYKLLKKSDAT